MTELGRPWYGYMYSVYQLFKGQGRFNTRLCLCPHSARNKSTKNKRHFVKFETSIF